MAKTKLYRHPKITIKAVNLLMIEAKTEFTHVYLTETSETNDDGNPERGLKEWRKSKIIGHSSGSDLIRNPV